MSAKKILKVILCTFGTLFILLFLLLMIMVYKGMGITIGRCLIADDGSYLMVDDSGPTVMSSDSKSMFHNLSTGDKILVVHSGVNESYPGSTDVYFCFRLSSGDIFDIPTKVILELTELGWLGNTEETTPYNYEIVQYVDDDARMSLVLLDNWEYELMTQDDSDGPCGIYFWPKDSSDGKVALLYYPFFGVCGTGLETEVFFIKDYKAIRGTYDSRSHWSYIWFDDYVTEFTIHDENEADWLNDYVILNKGADSWLDEYENELQFILESIHLGYHVEINEE